MHDDAPDLFGHIPPPASDSTALRSVGIKARRSPIQREFDRLVERIEHAEALLLAWREQPTLILSQYRDRMAPAIQELTDAQRGMVVQLDAFLTSPPKGLRMTARRRNALTRCMFDLLDAIASEAPDDPLLSLRERHGGSGPAASQDEADAEDMAQAVAFYDMLLHGESIEPLPGETVDAFVARAQARLEQTMEAEARRKAERRRRRAEKRAEKTRKKSRNADADAGAQVGQHETESGVAPPKPDLLRGLYRKLASSIHPDRERDPAEKARKTASMQHLNTAYQNKDLLGLLKLHGATLQQSTDADLTAEDTLREYNALLKAQLKSIEAEIFRTIDEVVPHGIAMTRGRPKRPEELQALMDADIRRVARVAQDLRTTLSEMNDPKHRTAAINDIVEMMESDGEFDEIEQLMRALHSAR